MNDKPKVMKPVPPFVKFVCANVPMAFDDSLSYYEALSALWKYVSDMTDVINNNAMLEEEFIAKFDELKTFVDTYFDNLDVQEEINAKLDEMAEDGTLADIINQEIFGEIQDDISEIQGDITNINNDIDNVESNIESIELEKQGIFGICRKIDTDYYAMLFSDNGKDFYQVGKTLPTGFGHDASSLCEINGVYYYISSNYYKFSTDLEHWSEDYIIEEGGTSSISAPYATGWGTMFYYDEDNELVYAYYARTYNEDNAITANGVNTRYFKISYQTGTIGEDGSINFSQDIHDLIFSDGDSYIDPYVIKSSGQGLLIAYKDEINLKIHISKMTSLTQMGSTTNICPIQGIEAPKLIEDEQGNVICYFDGYTIGNKTLLNSGADGYPCVSGYFYAVVNGNLRNAGQMAMMPCSYPFSTRHVGYMKTSAKMLHDIKKLGVTTFPTSAPRIYNMLRDDGIGYYVPIDGSTIVNFPYAIYDLSGTKTLTIKNYFRNEPLRFILRGTAHITFSNDSWIQSDCKGKTINGDATRNRQYFEFYPDSRNCLDGMWTTYDAS